MSLYNTCYHILVITAGILSLVAFKRGDKRFGFLAILLLITSPLELVTLYLAEQNINFFWLYNSYSILEYPLFASFLLGGVKNDRVSRVVVFSIALYIVAALSISTFLYHFKEYPGLNINIEGILLSILCTYILFNLEVEANRSILKTPDFWICSGILIYFGTSFFYNAVYAQISNLEREKIITLFNYLTRPLNIILYSFMIIGALCLPMRRKITLQ